MKTRKAWASIGGLIAGLAIATTAMAEPLLSPGESRPAPQGTPPHKFARPMSVYATELNLGGNEEPQLPLRLH